MRDSEGGPVTRAELSADDFRWPLWSGAVGCASLAIALAGVGAVTRPYPPHPAAPPARWSGPHPTQPPQRDHAEEAQAEPTPSAPTAHATADAPGRTWECGVPTLPPAGCEEADESERPADAIT